MPTILALDLGKVKTVACFCCVGSDAVAESRGDGATRRPSTVVAARRGGGEARRRRGAAAR